MTLQFRQWNRVPIHIEQNWSQTRSLRNAILIWVAVEIFRHIPDTEYKCVFSIWRHVTECRSTGAAFWSTDIVQPHRGSQKASYYLQPKTVPISTERSFETVWASSSSAAASESEYRWFIVSIESSGQEATSSSQCNIRILGRCLSTTSSPISFKIRLDWRRSHDGSGSCHERYGIEWRLFSDHHDSSHPSHSRSPNLSHFYFEIHLYAA